MAAHERAMPFPATFLESMEDERPGSGECHTLDTQLSCVDHVDGHTLSTIPLSVGCPDPSMLSNIFQETVPDSLIDITFSSAPQQQQPTFLTSAAVFSDASPAYSGVSYVDSEQVISCLQPSTEDLEIPLFTVPSLEDIRLDVLAKTWASKLSQFLSDGLWADAEIRFKTNSSYYGVLCHKVMLAAASPLLASCIMEAGNMEEPACIILPDFNGQEVEDFLGLLYLTERGGGQMTGVGPLFGCLVEGAALWATPTLHKLEAIVKAERKTDRTAAEIKMEEVDMKMKKKLEDAVEDSASQDKRPATSSMPASGVSVSSSTQRRPESGPFKCAVCGKVFRLRRILTMHEAVHSEPRLVCREPGCNRRFRKRFNLKAHVDVVHHGAKRYPCEICGRLYYNESKLKAHAVSHSSEKFICQHCPSIFAAAKTLRAHIRAQHSADGQVPRCSTCGKVFSTEMNLKSHISRVHLKEKRFPCPTCGKLFFENRQVAVHMASHSSIEKTLPCELCKRLFKTTKSLFAHYKDIHTDRQRKHVCELCGKSFRDGYHLDRHMDSHKQKSVFCPLCGKAVGSERLLQDHTRKVHEKWRRPVATRSGPRSCEICCKQFSDLSGLQRHRRNIHKETLVDHKNLLVPPSFFEDPLKETPGFPWLEADPGDVQDMYGAKTYFFSD